MSILTASNLGKSFGADDIFSGVSVEIPHKARIALVGPNGAGKTTLLGLLLGMDTPTEGTVSRMKGLRIGFLPQRPELSGAHTLWDEVMSGFDRLRAMERDLTALEHAIAAETDPTRHTDLLDRYGELQETFADAGGYSYESRVRGVLQGLSFTPADYEKPLALLSGGQKTRALLGRLLLEAPDLLALDEPTNHLDIEAVEWLEGFLKEFPGAVLVVSHDRYFMDAVASTVWELDFGTLETYRGNYSRYAEQREARHERLLKEYESQQEFIAKEMDYIRRNIAGQNTRQAKGRRTRLERLLRDEAARRPLQRGAMHLRMGNTLRSGDEVLKTRGLAVGYPDAPQPLFHAPDITLRRGEVAALIGANGAGKSTFVKTAIGQLPPLAGEVKIGAAVSIGYFEQAHESLTPSHTLLEEVLAAKDMPISQARDLLAQFMFTGDDVYRTIDTLSGGERGRVALAKLALTGANLLLLDEPTNHLDIASQEILQHVLAQFDGTILLVSHDRYLIDALATQIWAVSPGRLDVFKGPYAEWVAARDSARAAAESKARKADSTPSNGHDAAKSEKKHNLNPHQLQKRIAALEAQIPQLESALESVLTALNQATAAGDGGKVRALTEQYQQTEHELNETMREWERLID
ncbi:MAG: ABC-F family ATP-binding cassette domain-containing protein [bacterium]|nr:ABC-F family ATP-binding cassette domain-containing protein [bacterium]